MSTEEEWYSVLDVHPEASAEDVKAAYQNLLLALHPDKNLGRESAELHLVLQAWKVLGDPEERRRYDARRQQRQDQANVWKTVSLGEMSAAAEEEGHLHLDCRCGGAYLVQAEEVRRLSRLVIECDTCSLSLVVNNDDRVN
jgi:DnaJ-class molecular chaperone